MGDIYAPAVNQPKQTNASEDGVDVNAALTGDEVAHALFLDQTGQINYKPTHEDYITYKEWHKTQSTNILKGISEGAGQIWNDVVAAGGSVLKHPLESTAKLTPSLVEAFMQGTRNLYGMVAQSQDPDSVLFRFKDALSGSGSDEGYRQFLEARDFNKHSARLSSGQDTILMDKDIIDHNITQAASYIADPTLFIPFGAAFTAGMKAVGMGEKMMMLGARASALKGAVIGGTLKYGIGMPIEFLGDVTRGSIDRVASFGGAVVEATTGLSAKELKATARVAGVTGVVADAMGGHIPVVSQVSNAYVAAGVAQGVGSAVGAVGEQILKQGGKRGFSSFAAEALKNTPNLSTHAQNLLKIIDAVDPFLSYSATALNGMAHGAVIGGTLGYLNAGEEGMAHGMGAGIALGGIGAVAGRGFSDALRVRNEIQGQFVLDSMKATGHENYVPLNTMLEHATKTGGARGRSEALAAIAGIDRVGADVSIVMGNSDHIIAQLKSRGFDINGFKVDDKGNPTGAPTYKFNAEGLTLAKDAANKQTTIFINSDTAFGKNTFSHELFHAIFRTTVFEPKFKDMLNSVILGKFDEQGNIIKSPDIATSDFRQLADNYYKAHPQNAVDPNFHADTMKAFDEALNNYKKSGGKLGVNPDGTVNQDGARQAKLIDDTTEEFGAYYFSEFIRGKPLDYLYRGGNLGGVRGVMESMHSSFLDFWQKKVTKENPTFDFTKGTIDEAFVKNNGKRIRVGAVDYMIQDLIRAKSAQRGKGSSVTIDVRTMTPEQRASFFQGTGADALKHAYDNKGNPVSNEQETASRAKWGEDIKGAVAEIPEAERGNVTVHDDGSITGDYNDKVLNHLQSKGLISEELGRRIRVAQDCVSNPNASNVWTFDMLGKSQETSRTGETARKTGSEVEITHRDSIIIGTKFKINKDGTPSFVVQTLNKTVLDARGDVEWAKPETQALFGTRARFDTALLEYFKNAGMSDAEGRVESAVLLDGGDGLGGKRRDILHQVSGIPISNEALNSVGYKNPPIAPIEKGTVRVIEDLSLDRMSNVKTETGKRVEFNNQNNQASRFISQNWKVSELRSEDTPNGQVLSHESGYKLTVNKENGVKAFDPDGKSLGSFQDSTKATIAIQKAYESEQAKLPSIIDKGFKTQEKLQGNFKVIDEATRKEAQDKGDIFATNWGQEFTAGTKVIRQTREEFISSSMIRLRQSDPKAVVEIFKAKAAEIDAMKQQLEQVKQMKIDAYNKWKLLQDKASRKTLDLLTDKTTELKTKIGKYDIIDYAVQGDIAKGGDGKHILDVFNNLRENQPAYKDLGKMLFGDAENAQYQTGKPITVVATHGTGSGKLQSAMKFDAKYLGESGRHGDKNDSVGAFLAGSESTSMQYSEAYNAAWDVNTGRPLRQVRALVKMENPFVTDVNYRSFDKNLYKEIFDKAKAGGHDGVVIKNVFDGGSSDTIYVAMADKLESNTAILDTVETTDKAIDKTWIESPSQDANNLYYPANRPATPRGTTIKSDYVKGNWKVAEQLVQNGFEKTKLNEQLIASGHIVLNFDQSQLADKHIVINNPDTMMTGELKTEGGKVIAEGNGGLNFVSKYGDVWANSVKWKADQTVKLLKKAQEANGGVAYLALTRGDIAKTLNSHNGAKGGMAIIEHLVEQNLIDIKEFKSALAETGTKYGLNIDTSGDYKSIHEQIAKQFFGVKDATFEARGTFVKDIINHLAIKGGSGEANIKEIRTVLQSEKLGRKISFAPEGIKEAIGLLLSDKRANVEPSNVYAYLEIKGNISVKDTTGEAGHPSYPFHIISTDPKTGEKIRPRMLIPDKTSHITDLVNNEQGQSVPKTYKGTNKKGQEITLSGASLLGSNNVGEAYGIMKPKEAIQGQVGNARLNWKVSEAVKEGVQKTEDIINSNGDVVPKALGGLLKQFKEAIRRQDATDEIVVPQVRQTYETLRSQVQSELARATPLNKSALDALNKTLIGLDSKINKNQVRISKNVKRGMATDLQTGADVESAQSEANVASHEASMEQGADLESAQAQETDMVFDYNKQQWVKRQGDEHRIPATPEPQPAPVNQPIPEAQPAPQTASQPTPEPKAQSFANKAKAEAQRQAELAKAQAEAQAQAQQTANVKPSTQRASSQPQVDTEPSPPKAVPMERAYRSWIPEKSPNGSIWKNFVGYVIILSGDKLKVYNPEKALLGIYGTLDQAKLRVQKEEPKNK